MNQDSMEQGDTEQKGVITLAFCNEKKGQRLWTRLDLGTEYSVPGTVVDLPYDEDTTVTVLIGRVQRTISISTARVLKQEEH